LSRQVPPMSAAFSRMMKALASGFFQENAHAEAGKAAANNGNVVMRNCH